MHTKNYTEDFMSLPRLVLAAFVTLLLHSSVMYAAQTASCTFDTFSAPSGYSFSQIQGVSDDGTVVGQLMDNNTLQLVAFKRSAGGAFTEYAAPKSAATWLYGRNGSGTNTGFYQDSAYPGHIHGFLLEGSTFTVVNHPNAVNTWLFDVNLLGGAVGSFSAGAYVTKGFRLVNGNYTTIRYPNAQVTYALGINDNGDVVGTYASSLVSNGFLWKNGSFTTINYPYAKYGTVLTAVNNSGVIVGNHLSGDKSFGFIYENGVFKNIVYSGANYTMAGGINNNGLISGEIFLTGNTLGYTAVCK
jgi:probable HAF family extracellular repeat protein